MTIAVDLGRKATKQKCAGLAEPFLFVILMSIKTSYAGSNGEHVRGLIINQRCLGNQAIVPKITLNYVFKAA